MMIGFQKDMEYTISMKLFISHDITINIQCIIYISINIQYTI